MLLVLLRAVKAASERQDQRIVPLQLAEPAGRFLVVGQLVVGEDPAGDDVGADGWTPAAQPAVGGPAPTTREAASISPRSTFSASA
jgi:hypothetical protein